MKYSLKGIDCAQCAARIEAAMNRTEELREVRINFATATMELDPRLVTRARAILRQVEPGAEILSPRQDETADWRQARWRIARIAAAALLLLAGLLFNSRLHATSWSIAEYLVLLPAYLLVGWPVIRAAARSAVHGQVFNEMFLMTVATAGAIAIHEIPEAVAVMLFYSVGEHFQEHAVARSRRSISALLDLRPDTARVIEDGQARLVPPGEVAVGRIVEVLPGERVPLDGRIVEGSSAMDTSALTGESLPREVEEGDEVLAGFVNDHGRLRLRVTREFERSSVARIIELVENAAARRAPTEKFITRFAAVYSPIMVGAAVLLAFIPPLFVPGAGLQQWVYRALVLLVISCPCALVISIPLGYFAGIGGASRRSILVKGANLIDELRAVKTVIFDKTGTLTHGGFRVAAVLPRGGLEEREVLRWAALAESHSNHPIARSILQAHGRPVDPAVIAEYKEIRGHGVIARIDGRLVAAGNDRLLHREAIAHEPCDAAGSDNGGDPAVSGSAVHVAVDGRLAGTVFVTDEIKPGAAEAVRDLKALGVERVLMLTGDTEKMAREVTERLGLDGYHAGLLPEDKVNRVEEIRQAAGGKVAVVGDGVNDAPVLAYADVGMAMGALGSDAAIEAADVVIMDDDLARIPAAIRLSRYTHGIIVQNIVLALAVKGLFIALGAAGLAGMWQAVIGDIGVSLLAVLNSIRALGAARAG